MLSYLALSPGSHSRDSLAALLWPELDQRRARAEVRRTLSLLNRTLGDAWFAFDRETAGWAPQDEAWLDVDALRECLAAGAAHGHPPEEACEACVPLLTEAVALYRDGFLSGFTLTDSAASDEWQFFETESLRDALASIHPLPSLWFARESHCFRADASSRNCAGSSPRTNSISAKQSRLLDAILGRKCDHACSPSARGKRMAGPRCSGSRQLKT